MRADEPDDGDPTMPVGESGSPTGPAGGPTGGPAGGSAGGPAGGRSPSKPTRPSPRTIGGKYRLGRRLAGGAFGEVYEAHYAILGQERRVAVKLLRKAANDDPATTIRFREEVKTLCMLDHPNICKVIDGGVDAGQHFLVMDFAEGGSLKQQLAKAENGRIAAPQAIRWLREAASGLLAAEQNRDAKGAAAPVYHRDVKPENLLLQGGRVVVADFGAAKLGGEYPGVTSEIVPALWTPQYGSPEQAAGFADHRSDIYSLGATFFQLLTGQLTMARFEKPAQRFDTAHDPSTVCNEVPKALGAIVRRMTEPDKRERYASFEDLIRELEALERPPAARWPLRALVVVLLALATTGGLQAVGVIDLFGGGVQSGAPLGQVIDQVNALAVRLEEVRTRDLDSFDKLQGERTWLRQQLDLDQGFLQQCIDRQLPRDERVRLPAEFVPLDDIERRLGRLEQDLARIEQVRVSCAQLAAGLATRSGDALEGELLAMRAVVRELFDVGGLGKELDRLQQSVAAQRADRKARVDALTAAFEAGAFADLRADAERVSAEMKAVGEGTLAAVARGIAEDVGQARERAGQLPVWPPADRATDDVLACLDRLAPALDGLRELASQPSTPRVVEWLRAQAAKRRDEWLGLATEALVTRAAQLRQTVGAFDGRVIAAQRAGGSGLQQLDAERRLLLEQCDAFDRLRSTLSEVSAQNGSTTTELALRRLEMPRPTPVIAELAVFRDRVEQCERELAAGQFAPELREAVERVSAACVQLRERLGAVDAGTPDLRQLGRLDDALAKAHGDLEAARQVLLTFRALEADLDARSVAVLREGCRASSSTITFRALEEVRQTLLGRIEQIGTQREQRVQAVESDFTRGDTALTAMRERATALAAEFARIGEQRLAERALDVVAALAAAEAFTATLPAWSPAAGEATAGDLQTFAAVLASLIGSAPTDSSPLLARWWPNRQAQLASAGCRQAVERCRQLHAALLAKCTALRGAAADDPRRAPLTRELAEYDALLDALRGLAEQPLGGGLVAAVTLPRPELPPPPVSVAGAIEDAGPSPDGWPSAFRAPAGVKSFVVAPGDEQSERLFPPEFLQRVAGSGLRVWYFEHRLDKQGRPVPMVLWQRVDGTAAFLIDVHPVTLGEVRACREYYLDRRYYLRAFETLPDETLAFSFSPTLIDRFRQEVERAAGGTRYGLPPADYRESVWQGVEPMRRLPAVQPKADSYPKLVVPLSDVAMGGLAFLQSGVREWVGDIGNPRLVGRSEIPDDPNDAGRKRDTGFRLAIALSSVRR